MRKKRNRFRKLKNFLKITGVTFILFLVGAYFVVGITLSQYFTMAAGYNPVNLDQTTRIYSQDDQLLYQIYGEENRHVINSNEIPIYMKQATVAAEDKHFYHHPGVDPEGMVRAFWINFRQGKIEQGGSTIAQQLVKNAFFKQTRKRSYNQKLKEMIISVYMETKFSKDDILTFYLNQIPYGGNTYGVDAAAQKYFGKSANQLTLDEAATLAALPQAPSYYDPHGGNIEALTARRNYIITQMQELGFVSSEEAKAAQAKALVTTEAGDKIIAPHFVFEVKQQLISEYGKDTVERGGLTVVTSLNTKAQKIAESTIEQKRSLIASQGAENAGMVTIDPKTGEILAMVGSRNYFDSQIDGKVNVTTSLRQPGSAFKPIVYATLFKGKWSPGSTLFDVQTNFGTTQTPYTPSNYDGKFRGPVSVREALGGSLNIPAVKALSLAGIDESIATAQDLGITTFEDKNRFGLSLVLGGGEVKLVELAGAYSAFANNGVAQQVTYLKEVKDKNGNQLYEHISNNKAVIDPAVAYEISSILSDNTARTPIFGPNSPLTMPGKTVAAKTGTTQNYKDAWTVGYTPSVIVGVWVGNNNGRPLKYGADGVFTAAPIWNAAMTEYMKDLPNEEFKAPGSIQTIEVDKITGLKVTKASKGVRKDIYASWQEPATAQTATVVVCNKEQTVGYAVHSERPDNPNWEQPVIAWARKNGYPTGNVSIACKDQQPQVADKEKTKNVGGGTEPIKIDKLKDEKAPDITLNCQEQGSHITCDVGATDEGGIKSLSLVIGGESFTLPPNGGSASWKPPGPGTYQALATAIDNEGNQASKINTIIISPLN